MKKSINTVNSLKTKIATRGIKDLDKQVAAMNATAAKDPKTEQPKVLTRAEKIKAAWAAKRAEKERAKTTPVIDLSAVVANSDKVAQAKQLLEKCIENDRANSQTAKADAGKAQLHLVPTEIMTAIARIREYGNKKYKDPENWKTVSADRYIDATLRHTLAFANDLQSKDLESGLPHLWHAACNIAFLIHMAGGVK